MDLSSLPGQPPPPEGTCSGDGVADSTGEDAGGGSSQLMPAPLSSLPALFPDTYNPSSEDRRVHTGEEAYIVLILAGLLRSAG